LSISIFLRNALPVRSVRRFGFKVGRSEFAYRTSSSAMEANEFTAMTSTSSMNHQPSESRHRGPDQMRIAKARVMARGLQNQKHQSHRPAHRRVVLPPVAGAVRARMARPAASFGSKGFVS
jgi:hypothetical protein